jgi:hypothetical protein
MISLPWEYYCLVFPLSLFSRKNISSLSKISKNLQYGY